MIDFVEGPSVLFTDPNTSHHREALEARGRLVHLAVTVKLEIETWF